MFTNNFLALALMLSVLLALPLLQQVESAPSDIHHTSDFHQHPVVYRRYVRRRPPMYLNDNYMEEIIEIFDTQEKPPAYGAIITDEDVDKFIFCDFNRHLDICKHYWDSGKFARPSVATTTKKTSSKGTAPKPTTTTTDATTKIIGIPHLDEVYYNYYDEENEETVDNNDYYLDELEV